GRDGVDRGCTRYRPPRHTLVGTAHDPAVVRARPVDRAVAGCEGLSSAAGAADLRPRRPAVRRAEDAACPTGVTGKPDHVSVCVENVNELRMVRLLRQVLA